MPWCTRCGTGISQMEMNEGYQDREDPGLTVRLPLVDRPGEWLLVWTTTPWTLSANVAAAVGPELAYVRVRQGEDQYWLGKGTLKTALRDRFKVLEERPGRDLVGWRYRGPYDELPAVRPRSPAARATTAERATSTASSPWAEVSEEEGTGIVHIAPGAGAEDYQLGKALGLPVIAPLDEDGHYLADFGWLSGLDAHGVAERVMEDLIEKGLFYHLEPYSHRYPHCWRCGTALLFRVVDEWYIIMGEVYDKPRDQVTADEKERSLRYQIMDVVDDIRWIPGFGYERELDWLRTMSDWMISKKRYWGLALPIWECASCGSFEVVGSAIGAARSRGRGLGRVRGPHAASAARRRGQDRLLDLRRSDRRASPTWAIPGWTRASCRSRRSTTGPSPTTGAKWFPADFITESFPGQFRNWFYSMLAMSTVLRREPPFKTILGYATLFGEDGRAMHKSWGNSIEFNEAAERMGVDVMRWMYARQRPEDNILFGYRTADEARRELLVLWNVYAFFVTFARLAAWRPLAGIDEHAVSAGAWPTLDRWILSRTAALTEDVGARLADFDALGASRLIGTYIDDLSTWYLRRSRDRMRARRRRRRSDAAFATLHAALVALARMLGADPALRDRGDVPEPRW